MRVASEEKFMSGQSARFTAAGSSCRPNLNFKMWRCLSDHVKGSSQICATRTVLQTIFFPISTNHIVDFWRRRCCHFLNYLTWCEKMTGPKRPANLLGYCERLLSHLRKSTFGNL